mgnify:CR=1 FL=1
MKKLSIAAALCALCISAAAQPSGEGSIARYEIDLEAFSVNENYVLPDVLTCNNGEKVRNLRQWEKKRRPEIMAIYENEMFGKVPERPSGMHFVPSAPDSLVFGGKALRRRVMIYLDKEEKHGFEIMLHLPVSHAGRIPMFVALNFRSIADSFDGTRYELPYETFVDEGFGFAVAFHSSIEPDIADYTGESADVRGWYRPAEEWGAISAWAMGLSCIADYLETLPEVDMGKLVVAGHSRLGKTALWAGANDPRFAIVISNNSGCCGAATNARMYGETFRVIYDRFPYWFIPAFSKYSGRDCEFPVDQNALAALSAPRPVYIASASEDHWADPYGEWLTALNAGPVYALYGLKGLSGRTMPALGHCDDYGSVAYKIHEGPHALWADDWLDYIKFAKRHFDL